MRAVSAPHRYSRLLLAAFAAAALLPSACTTTPQAQSSAAAQRRLPMGTLVGREARVAILATGHGVRYDVRTSDGQLLASNLTAAEVARRVPGQDPRGAWAMADEPVLLMQAEWAAFEP